jgi:hypothetical protein
LDALKNFETQNPKIPDDARAVMDVFRGQQGTILGRPLESAYHQALDHLKNTGYKNAETWLSIHVTRAYRKRMEGLLNK